MTRGGPILFVDYCRVPDKYKFLDAFGRAMGPQGLIVVDGRGCSRIKDAEVLTEMIRVYNPSKSLFRSSYLQRFISSKLRFKNLSSEWLEPLTDQLALLNSEKCRRCSRTQAEYSLLSAFHFTLRVMKRWNPSLMIVWNQFHPLSLAAQCAADRLGVKTAFVEYGLLPGSLNFDFLGQMGESAVALKPDVFDALSVEQSDIEVAERTLEKLRRSCANRRKQPNPGRLLDELRLRANGRPIILFVGHNDHASGVLPYDDRARHFHSPHYATSSLAARALAEVAATQDWFVVYKPHPFAERAQQVPQNDHLAVIGEMDIHACIDMADCVVTVLSQVSYVALIREKPLVMLGYNQLRDKGCHYQAETREEIAGLIAIALEEGFTFDQKLAWRRHAAQLLKYYLYRYDGIAPSLDAARRPVQLAEIVRTSVNTGCFEEF